MNSSISIADRGGLSGDRTGRLAHGGLAKVGTVGKGSYSQLGG